MTNLQPEICGRPTRHRTGSVYLAVLGTSLIVTMLALSALGLQRIQNRMLTSSADVRQAQLNAETAVQLGWLAMKQNANWRTTYANVANGSWFSGRETGAGTCSLTVTDPLDGDLDDDPDDPVVMLGVGTFGSAVQQMEHTVDPRRESLGCLRSAVAAGNAINLTGSVLRAANSGLISANSVSASASTVYGNVEAVTISGSTYVGSTTQIGTGDRPEMPDWDTVFDYYRTNGTEININSVPSSTPNVGRNVGIEVGATYWTGDPLPGIVPTATVSQSPNHNHTTGGANSMRVQDRSAYWAGANQSILHLVEPGASFYVEVWVRHQNSSAVSFVLTLYTKGSGAQSNTSGSVVSVPPNTWTLLTATMSVPNWNGSLEAAFVKIGGIISQSGNTTDFYADDLVIRKVGSDRYIYRQVLGPGVNPFGGTLNSQGIYWINCGGNRLLIERSRIRGTLLVVNPGAGSSIGAGPINWSPAVAGYPALLVDADTLTSADFTIAATNRVLSEAENGVDYNLDGIPNNYIYPSEIQGLIVIGDRLTYRNDALIRGQIIVGNVTASSGALEIVYQPDSLINPPPGFTAPHSHNRRPGSVRKTVLP